MKIILIITTSTLVLLVIIIWYKIKFILDDNKYHVNYFFQHFTDIPNFVSLIKKEKDSIQRNSYIKLLTSLTVILILTISCFIFLLNRYS